MDCMGRPEGSNILKDAQADMEDAGVPDDRLADTDSIIYSLISGVGSFSWTHQ